MVVVDGSRWCLRRIRHQDKFQIGDKVHRGISRFTPDKRVTFLNNDSCSQVFLESRKHFKEYIYIEKKNITGLKSIRFAVWSENFCLIFLVRKAQHNMKLNLHYLSLFDVYRSLFLCKFVRSKDITKLLQCVNYPTITCQLDGIILCIVDFTTATY